MKKSKKFIPMQNNLVLAIDPGFDRVGVAVLKKDGVKEKLVFSHCILTNKQESQATRLEQIGREIKKIIKKHKPNCLAIEKLFFNQNTSTALRVAEARGVILYESTCAGLEVFEYSPQEIKIAVTGYGKASKGDVELMTLKLLALKTSPKHDDEVDACALGITHLVSFKHKKLLSTD
jgi:crossover junction endodeoxyribonuclease RuvC